MIVNAEHDTVAPDTIDSESKFRSAPDVPTLPEPTTDESDFSITKYPAVPVFPAVPT